MTTLILLLIVFFAVWFFSDSLFFAVIATVLVGAFLDINPDELKKTAKEELAKIEQTMEGHDTGPESDIHTKELTIYDAHAENFPKESISDKLRESTPVLVMNREKACHDTNNCFKMRLRRHDNGILYACEVDGMRCYPVTR